MAEQVDRLGGCKKRAQIFESGRGCRFEGGKRGDIGSTASAYAAGHLADISFEEQQDVIIPDAITVNPFCGLDTLAPFVQTAKDYDKGLFVLVRTSNPGSGVRDSQTRQTGAGRPGASADELYDAIRADKTDVAEIAKNTGIKPQNIQKVKDHLFYNEHLLDRYADQGEPAVMARFDSDLGIAKAWERLRAGNFTDADMQLLRHEAAEANRMRSWGPGYSRAHDAAESRFPVPNLEDDP